MNFIAGFVTNYNIIHEARTNFNSYIANVGKFLDLRRHKTVKSWKILFRLNFKPTKMDCLHFFLDIDAFMCMYNTVTNFLWKQTITIEVLPTPFCWLYRTVYTSEHDINIWNTFLLFYCDFNNDIYKINATTVQTFETFRWKQFFCAS